MNLTEEQFQEMLARTQANMKGGDATSAESPRAHTGEPRRGGTSSGAPNPPYTASKRVRGPNKWEQSYAQQELEPRRIVGEIAWYGFEAMKLRLAYATYYTPDFVVLLPSGRMEFREVKGFVRDDAIVKLKVAAELFPFRFTMLRKKKVSEGGGWEVMRDLNVRS